MSGSEHYSDGSGEISDAELENLGGRNGRNDNHRVDGDSGDNEDNEPGNGGGVRVFLRFLRELEAVNALPSSSDEESDDEIPDGGEQLDFDVQEPSGHRYLFRGGSSSGEVDVSMTTWLEPGEFYRIPIIEMDLVVLPGQLLPMQTRTSTFRFLIKSAIDQKSYLGLLPVVGDCEDGKYRYGILLQVNKYVDNGLTMKVHAVGRQRFRVLSKDHNDFGSSLTEVEVLRETVLPPLLRSLSPLRALKISRRKQLDLCCVLTNIPKFAIISTSLESQCEHLGNWMKMWFPEEKVKSALNLGPIGFSYWVASNLPVDLVTKYGYLVEDETDMRVAKLLQTVTGMTSIVCKACDSLICDMRDLINMNVEGNSSHFVNNGGYIHEMFTVLIAQNFAPRDRPSAKFSWFPGYKWQIIECRMCMEHLGWEFTSRRYNPAKFYGITRKAVVPRKMSNPDI